jgi:hypothetical protein
VICALLLAACAALPDDAPVVEELDEKTGATISRLGRPIELYRENFREDATGERFAFLGPFETNNMGNRTQFLLIGLPEERAAAPVPPELFVNGTRVELDTPGHAPDFAGLRDSPYRIPTPWVEMYYYRVDAALVARLGEATDLRIEVMENTRTGPRKLEYVANLANDPRLRVYSKDR